ncbi:hypothetical protein JB92DRAFT_2830808 [Gautieria morchelliformis]|nr:hypothetical protein JB92DRAFT_2830808 [Gautieria morchelliformis]
MFSLVAVLLDSGAVSNVALPECFNHFVLACVRKRTERRAAYVAEEGEGNMELVIYERLTNLLLPEEEHCWSAVQIRSAEQGLISCSNSYGASCCGSASPAKWKAVVTRPCGTRKPTGLKGHWGDNDVGVEDRRFIRRQA